MVSAFIIVEAETITIDNSYFPGLNRQTKSGKNETVHNLLNVTKM